MGKKVTHQRSRSVLAAGLSAALSLSALAPSYVTAQPKPGQDKMGEARSRYERGKQLYEEGAFDAALIEFQRAYELAPSYRILFNIGQVYRQQNDYAGALRAFERYLSEGGGEIDGKRREEIEKELSSLRGRVAKLTITTNVAGAEISIDDVSVGKAPLAGPITVNAGKRRVSASVHGRVPTTKVITLAGSDNTSVALELADPRAPAPVPSASSTGSAAPAASPAPVQPPPPPAEESSAPLVGWVATGVLAVGAVVVGALAFKAAGDLKDERGRAGATRDDLDSARSKTKSTALVADILTGAAVVVGGISLYLTVSKPSKEQAARPFSPQVVRVGIGPGSLSLGGEF
jgi:hypothetical protein